MDMTMSMTMSEPTTAMSGMSMSTAPSSMSTSMSMPMSHSSTMGMSDMAMVFFTSTMTPLYSSAWTPSSTSEYAGTCIFLIALATIFRAVLALKSRLDATVWPVPPRRAGGVPFTTTTAAAATPSDDSVDGESGIREFAAAKDGAGISAVTRMPRGYPPPWRINVDGSRALLDVVIAGLSYLLMLAVMTMNVGYFMSILGGTFLGSFIWGRWSARTSSMAH